MTLSDIPLLPGARLLGHVREVRHHRMSFLRRLAREARDVTRLRIYTRSFLLVTGPAQVQEVLVDKARSFQKSPILRYLLYPLAGEGLFTSGGALWRRQRKLMAPLFHPEKLADYAQAMVDSTLRDVATWQDGATLDMSQETTRITMSIAGSTLFGVDTFSDADEIGAALTVALRWMSNQAAAILPLMQTAVRKGLEHASDRMQGRPAALLSGLASRLHGPVLFHGEPDQRLLDAVDLLSRRMQLMIDERRAGGWSRPDLLSRLLSARDEDDGARMSDQQVRDEVLTLFVAGHETTATALAWGLYLLCRHPEAYRRAQAEADALHRPPRFEDAPRLPYCLQVFKESLRLYPPVPMFGREATEPVSLAGHELPRDTVVLICPYATHHRADLWPDPERFDPERFTPKAEESRPRYAYLPFSAGPRVCIGNHFALLEGPLVLATLLQQADFALESDAPIEPEAMATLRPKGGVPMRVRMRGAVGAAR